MSKDEKRYFTQMVKGSSGGRNNLGLQLFKLINENLSKNNEEIDSKITFTKNKSKLKNNLYNQLLEITSNYSLEKSLYPKLRIQLNKIDLLYNRGMHGATLKLVNATIKQAESIEANKILVELYEYKMNLLQHQNAKIEDSQKISEKGRMAMGKAEAEFESYKLLTDAFVVNRMLGIRKNKKYDKHYKELIEKASQIEKPTSSFKTKYYINSLNSIYHSYYGNEIEEHEATRKTYLLFEESPLVRKYNSASYIVTLNNHAVSKLKIKDYAGAIELFNQMNTDGLSNFEKMTIFQFRAANQLSAYIALGDIENIVGFVKEVVKGLDMHERYFSDLFKVITLINLAEYYFWKKDYGKAKQYTNRLLNESYSNVRRDVVRFAHTFNLIICFESGDMIYLQYLLKTFKTTRKLKNKTRTELWVIQFMEEVLKTVKLANSFYVNKELELLKIVKKHGRSSKSINLQSFDFLVWMRLKTDKKSLREIREEFNTKELTDYVEDRIKQLS